MHFCFIMQLLVAPFKPPRTVMPLHPLFRGDRQEAANSLWSQGELMDNGRLQGAAADAGVRGAP